jgi:hypothetical protein
MRLPYNCSRGGASPLSVVFVCHGLYERQAPAMDFHGINWCVDNVPMIGRWLHEQYDCRRTEHAHVRADAGLAAHADQRDRRRTASMNARQAAM